MQNRQDKAFLSSFIPTLFTRAAYLGLSFLTSYFLARILGAGEYGIYVYISTWLGLFTVIGTFGFHELLLREYSSSQSPALSALYRMARRYAFRIAAGTSALAAFIILFSGMQNKLNTGILIGAVTLPPLVFLTLHQNIVQGVGKIALSQLPESIIRPVVLLALIFTLRPYVHPDGTYALIYNFFSIVMASYAAWMMARHFAPYYSPVMPPPDTAQKKLWLGSAAYFLALQLSQFFNDQSDLLLLGILRSSEEVGIYAVAGRLSGLMLFFLFITNKVVAPDIARLYAGGDHASLQRLLTRSIRLTFLLSLPAGVIFILHGQWLLGWFGGEYTAGHTPLMLLTLGQLVNIAFGSTGYILMMTGHEKYALRSTLAGILANLAAGAALIPAFGMEGAAAAIVLGIITWNALAYLYVVRKTGLHPSVFGQLMKKQNK